LKKILTLAITSLLLISTFSILQLQVKSEDSINSNEAPSDYVPIVPEERLGNSEVLVIEDIIPWYTGYWPWNIDAIPTALDTLGKTYDLIHSDRLATIDLTAYKIVILASTQGRSTYERINENIEKINEFVSKGGIYICHACDHGWGYPLYEESDWSGLQIMPGGVTHVNYYSMYIHITNPASPIVVGLDDAYFAGWGYSTHGYFTNVPPDADIVMVTETYLGSGVPDPNKPTFIVYSYGSGKVIATMQTVEWGWGGVYYWVGGYRKEFLLNEISYAQTLTAVPLIQKMVNPVKGKMLYPRNAFRGYCYQSYYKRKLYKEGDLRLNTLVFKPTPQYPKGFHEYLNDIIVDGVTYKNYLVYHEGIDIFSEPKGKTDPVNASASGTIVYVDNVDNSSAGKWIWIWHGDIAKLDGTIEQKISTRYLHLDSIDENILKYIKEVLKKDPNSFEGWTNIPINKGDKIGTVGNTGCKYPHLHFEVRQGDIPKYPKAIDVYNTMPLNPCEFVDYKPPSLSTKALDITSECPVDLVVIDPDGLIISKEVNQLPTLAQYIEVKYYGEDEDGGGHGNYDEIIIEERKIGRYLISVIPEPETTPTDTYTLEVASAGTTFILAENVQICNIPVKPYIIVSTETEIIPIIPATIDFDPDTLNLKSNGEWVTVYVELPVGHGYNLTEIDRETIMLNYTLQVDTFWINQTLESLIGDYDNDTIPDLMIKFNRAALLEFILKNVELELRRGYLYAEVTLTITGKVAKVPFEGSDKIKVIIPLRAKACFS
jgi:hypothetical protein